MQQSSAHYLQVAPLHRLYYACFGNPKGIPLLFLHGGPGSGCNPADAVFFQLDRYYLIQLDQRGCGKSQAAGSIEHNTTAYLLEDLETLRTHLGIQHWQVYGGSWGAALALEYAKQHPSVVTRLILRGSFLARASDVEWFFAPQGVAQHLPAAYAQLLRAIDLEHGADITQRLYTWLKPAAAHCTPTDAELERAYQAAWALTVWNHQVMGFAAPPPEQEPAARLRRIQRELIFAHYCAQQFFLGPAGVLTGIEQLAGLPVVLIHGRSDQVCPLAGAKTLQAHLQQAELYCVEAGHVLQEPAIVQALAEVLAK